MNFPIGSDKRRVVFILGHGMLGQAAFAFFSQHHDLWDARLVNIRVLLSSIRELQELIRVPNSIVLNCIAKIPQGSTAPISDAEYMQSNAMVPLLLRQVCLSSQRIVHMSTNGIFPTDLETGKMYDVDCELRDQSNAYALSKTLGETACARDERILVVRASIIGPSSTGRGLVEFVRSKESRIVKGFANHLWNGVTTLHWCELVEKMMIEDSHWGRIVQMGLKKPITKHQLICQIAQAYGIEVKVEETQAPSFVNQCLVPTIPCDDLSKQLKEISKFNNK